MGRSLQLLTQVGSAQFSKCVSLLSLSSSLSAPSLWTPTSTRKSAKSSVVVSLKGSARTTGHALHTQGGTGPAMTAMIATTGTTTAPAELTTTRERLRLRRNLLLWPNLLLMLTLTPTMASMGMALDMDTAMVTFTDQPFVRSVLSN